MISASTPPSGPNTPPNKERRVKTRPKIRQPQEPPRASSGSSSVPSTILGPAQPPTQEHKAAKVPSVSNNSKTTLPPNGSFPEKPTPGFVHPALAHLAARAFSGDHKFPGTVVVRRVDEAINDGRHACRLHEPDGVMRFFLDGSTDDPRRLGPHLSSRGPRIGHRSSLPRRTPPTTLGRR